MTDEPPWYTSPVSKSYHEAPLGMYTPRSRAPYTCTGATIRLWPNRYWSLMSFTWSSAGKSITRPRMMVPELWCVSDAVA
ncbi:hypothetical protein D3C85_1866300 [compost metagenome]